MRRAPARGTRRADPEYAGHALHAEWTKARTAGGTIWLLLTIIATTIAVGGAVATATRCPAAGCGQDPARVSLSGIDLGQAVVAILAVLAISGELGVSHRRSSGNRSRASRGPLPMAGSAGTPVSFPSRLHRQVTSVSVSCGFARSILACRRVLCTIVPTVFRGTRILRDNCSTAADGARSGFRLMTPRGGPDAVTTRSGFHGLRRADPRHPPGRSAHYWPADGVLCPVGFPRLPGAQSCQDTTRYGYWE